jgi:hypothetical protein
MRVEITRRLDDRRTIEASADRRGTLLRLRARLCEDNIVVEMHRRDFDLDDATAVETFSTEFSEIAGLFLPALFPADMFDLKCPAAPPHWADAVVWGICAGIVEEPRVVPIPPEPVTPEIAGASRPGYPARGL